MGGLTGYETGKFTINAIEFSFMRYGRLVIATALTNHFAQIDFGEYINSIFSCYAQRYYGDKETSYNPVILYDPGSSNSIYLDTTLGTSPKAIIYLTVIGIR